MVIADFNFYREGVMLIISEHDGLSGPAQVELSGAEQTTRQRYAELVDEYGKSEIEGLATFLLLEPGDSADDLVAHLGFSPLINRYTGDRYDSCSYTPSFEFIEDHEDCYEILFVLSDDGTGVELFVPKDMNCDPDILAMCRRFSVGASTRRGSP